MEERFNSKVLEVMAKKKQNTVFLTKDKYQSLIQKVNESKSKIVGKTPLEHNLLKKFDVLKVGDTEKLICPLDEGNQSVRFYAHFEELFGLVQEAHTSIGHGGRTRMLKELQKKYKNITIQIIMIYLNLCEICQKKSQVPKKGLVVKPLLSKEMNSRCQIDLIDMQAQADSDFKFIFVYQDHLTKFVQLRPLKSKRAEEVAHVLLDIFCAFGAPSILQSDNGREFCNRVIEELCSKWKDLKIVHGKPRHSQSQGSVERANQDIESMLSSWMETHHSTKWSEGLRFVQFSKNRAHHTGINCSPYEAMFGVPAKVGLKTSSLPKEALDSISTEEDLEVMLEQVETNHLDNDAAVVQCDVADNQLRSAQESEQQSSVTESNEDREGPDKLNEEEAIQRSQRHASVAMKRTRAKEGLQQEAKKMMKTSSHKFPPDKCKCKKSQKLCQSKCHDSLPCHNK
ncbi:hypothetical protein M8J77_001334 [Diaphorina citri]|nr:hypothetical protein M8J77_001334 [Diaphorina citri]